MKRRIKQSFTRQHDQSDCGVACLASIIRFHGGQCSLEALREISGTSQKGTSLLRLQQTAAILGFAAEGLRAENIENLRDLEGPAILHVVQPNRQQHYVIFYEFRDDHIIIGDPASGIAQYSFQELTNIWQSKALLKLVTTPSFKPKLAQDRDKRRWIIDLVMTSPHKTGPV